MSAIANTEIIVMEDIEVEVNIGRKGERGRLMELPLKFLKKRTRVFVPTVFYFYYPPTEVPLSAQQFSVCILELEKHINHVRKHLILLAG